jgi:hypothetical protein
MLANQVEVNTQLLRCSLRFACCVTGKQDVLAKWRYQPRVSNYFVFQLVGSPTCVSENG